MKTFKFNCGKDLHRKGNLEQIDQMEKLAKELEAATEGGLTPAYLTEAFLGCDGFGMIATNRYYENQQGAVMFDLDNNEPIFVPDQEMEEYE